MRIRPIVPCRFALSVFITGTMMCMVIACAPVVSSSSVSVGPLLGMEFVTIPGGSFWMGSPLSEQGRDRDEKHHLVNVSSFELMTTEVTQAMWQELMGNIPTTGWGVGSNLPVYDVDGVYESEGSWYDCIEFIDRLNDLDSHFIYRLPTEAEWEYACRAGTTTAYYWGSTMNSDYCWYEGNSVGLVHPVGQKLPNAWGLYDMSGNALEWCEDVYTSNYDYCPNDGSAYTGSGPFRVLRGGSVDWPARFCRSAERLEHTGDYSSPQGFRLARSAR